MLSPRVLMLLAAASAADAYHIGYAPEPPREPCVRVGVELAEPSPYPALSRRARQAHGGAPEKEQVAGFAFESEAGHGVSALAKTIPDFGKQLSVAGKENLARTDDHKLDANAFAARTFPDKSLPNYNTYGGGVDYTYKERVGASLSAAHTPMFQRTDLSAMGNVNLLKTPTSSLDLNAGFTRSVAPYIPSSSWQPAAGIIFRKSW